MTILTSFQLFDSPYTVLSSHIADVLPPTYELTRIENKLMDGTVVVQTVGTPVEIRQVTLYCSDVEVEALNLVWANSTKVKLLWPSKYVDGYIRTEPAWAVAGYLYYQTTLTLLVDGSGGQT